MSDRDWADSRAKAPVAADAGEEHATTQLGALVERFGPGAAQRVRARMVQRKAAATATATAGGAAASEREGSRQQLADEGTRGAGQALPHLDAIQKSFGRHDVTGAQAHLDDGARSAAKAMGAHAFASGDHVAFARSPDLHTAAHEAAHLVQQRGGVQLKGGAGEEGDAHERHADAVADRVVAGQSAENLLNEYSGGSGASRGAVQLLKDDERQQVEDYWTQWENKFRDVGHQVWVDIFIEGPNVLVVRNSALNCDTVDQAKAYIDEVMNRLYKPYLNQRKEESSDDEGGEHNYFGGGFGNNKTGNIRTGNNNNSSGGGKTKNITNNNYSGFTGISGYDLLNRRSPSPERNETEYTGLFGQNTLNEQDYNFLTSRQDNTQQILEERRRNEQQRFNFSDGAMDGYRFVFGTTSASRHVEGYVRQYGLPRGFTMTSLREDLFKAAAKAIQQKTLGRKGYGGTVAIRGEAGTWNLIIESLGNGRYSLEHVDLDGIY